MIVLVKNLSHTSLVSKINIKFVILKVVKVFRYGPLCRTKGSLNLIQLCDLHSSRRYFNSKNHIAGIFAPLLNST